MVDDAFVFFCFCVLTVCCLLLCSLFIVGIMLVALLDNDVTVGLVVCCGSAILMIVCAALLLVGVLGVGVLRFVGCDWLALMYYDCVVLGCLF